MMQQGGGMKRIIAGAAMAPLLALSLWPAWSLADTEAAREREARLERARHAMAAADARTRSQEARDMINERGFATRQAVVQRNQGEDAVNPDAGYDQRTQRGIHQEGSEY